MNIDYARQQMVQQQVRSWEVLDEAVLNVLERTPREHFVPEGFEALAFAEAEIPLGHGETMLTPVMEGRILQALGVSAGNEVLDVGSGSGYLAACLAGLGGAVTSIDVYPEFTRSAGRNLDDMGVRGVDLETMDATRELPDGPFDAIAVTGSIERFDPRFVDALKPGGRLFVVVGAGPAMEARLVIRGEGNDWQSETLFETTLKALVNGALPPQFLF